MNKADLIGEVAKVVGTAKEAKAAVECVFSNITRVLQERDEVRVAGFGTFKVNRKKSRTGVNPRTGEHIQIGEKMVPKFLPAKELREAVD